MNYDYIRENIVPILSQAERRAIISGWNAIAREYDPDDEIYTLDYFYDELETWELEPCRILCRAFYGGFNPGMPFVIINGDGNFESLEIWDAVERAADLISWYIDQIDENEIDELLDALDIDGDEIAPDEEDEEDEEDED